MTEALYAADAYRQSCRARVTAVGERGVQLDRTVFYAAGGGQPGDSGVLRFDGGELAIADTVKRDGAIVHLPAAGASLTLSPGTEVEACIDWPRRYRHMKMHTCMHLLCSLVNAPVTGGSIGADRARLDFDLPEPVDKQQLTAGLNELIGADRAVSSRWITDAELDAQPELVKTLSVKPPRGSGRVRLLEIEHTDLQPCGGTHVARTGEIGPVKVIKIEKKSRLNRRIVVAFDEPPAV